jgi:hypothetical protein
MRCVSIWTGKMIISGTRILKTKDVETEGVQVNQSECEQLPRSDSSRHRMLSDVSPPAPPSREKPDRNGGALFLTKDSSILTHLTMPGDDSENERLAHADYWDDRYAQTQQGQQVHEWFRSFQDLDEFFSRHLFQTRAADTSPHILHLGSGDSASCPCLWPYNSRSIALTHHVHRRSHKTSLLGGTTTSCVSTSRP